MNPNVQKQNGQNKELAKDQSISNTRPAQAPNQAVVNQDLSEPSEEDDDNDELVYPTNSFSEGDGDEEDVVEQDDYYAQVYGYQNYHNQAPQQNFYSSYSNYNGFQNYQVPPHQARYPYYYNQGQDSTEPEGYVKSNFNMNFQQSEFQNEPTNYQYGPNSGEENPGYNYQFEQNNNQLASNQDGYTPQSQNETETANNISQDQTPIANNIDQAANETTSLPTQN